MTAPQPLSDNKLLSQEDFVNYLATRLSIKPSDPQSLGQWWFHLKYLMKKDAITLDSRLDSLKSQAKSLLAVRPLTERDLLRDLGISREYFLSKVTPGLNLMTVHARSVDTSRLALHYYTHLTPKDHPVLSNPGKSKYLDAAKAFLKLKGQVTLQAMLTHLGCSDNVYYEKVKPQLEFEAYTLNGQLWLVLPDRKFDVTAARAQSSAAPWVLRDLSKPKSSKL